MKRNHLVLLILCFAYIGCKTVATVEEPKKFHDIELICGNASATIAGKNIRTVLLAQEPKTKQKLIVEVYFDETGVKIANALIRKNSGKELSLIIPGRMLLVGKMDQEIQDDKVSIASYSQAVAEEIVALLTKK